MKKSHSIARAYCIRPILAAALAVAMAFTLSCSDDGGGDVEGTLTDSRDNQEYKWVKIGSRIWMAENLNYNASSSKCYENEPDNCQKYGRLYDWNTAMEICPSGWHLPSGEEWQSLVDLAGGDYIAGTKLKATSGWNNNGNGTDDYGFAALPGGYGASGSDFRDIGYYGDWWSTKEFSDYSAYTWAMASYSYEGLEVLDNAAIGYYYNKLSLRSVRCVRD